MGYCISEQIGLELKWFIINKFILIWRFFSMKKRAKQLAMLGLAVTMVVGTQMTAFASGLGEEAPVAIETEAKETANEETEEVKVEAKEEKADAKEEVKTEVKEEVVTGTEVAETPVVEETEVKETVAGTEELVGLGISVEAEAETEAPAEKEDAVEDAVPTSAPQTEVEANADTNTEAEVETEAEDKEVTAPTVNYTSNMTVFDAIKAQDIVLTFNLDYDGKVTGFEGDVLTVNGKIIGYTDEQISDKEIRFTLDGKSVADRCKALNLKDGDTLTFNTSVWGFVYADGNGDEKVASFPQVTLTYSDGTVTPEPEKPQPEPEKPQPDGGNGGTETPDPEKDGWIKTDEGWKYYENGQKVTGWKAVSEKWYYFNENGIMETGWASVSGHWYYLNADGSMATGWVSVGGHWYYLNTDGTMVTGWASVGGHWYYLNTDGSMATGWASVGGHWYYLNEDGTMASNQWIDGWYVDASGKML